MSIADAVLMEWDQEMAATRAVLERVPDDKVAWQPHEKSMTLGRLASHVAELPGWAGLTLATDEFDVNPPGAEQTTGANLGSRSEILGLFDESSAAGREAIAHAADAVFDDPWTLKSGGEAVFSAPKAGVLRRFVLNHMIHHRGQLTVFLRLCDVPVPQTMGPTADEPDF